MTVLCTQVRAAKLMALTALLATIGLLAVPSGALAGYTHPFLSSFGSFSNVQGVAVDSASGAVYVYDGGTGEVLKFDASGNPVNFSSTGTNAIKGAGSAGGDEGEIAVDSSSGPAKGDIYVAHAGSSIDVFNEAGEKIGALTEEPSYPWGEACGIAVDAGGNVYVGLYPSHIDKFAPTGNPVKNTDYASSMARMNGVCNVGADSLGDAYSITWQAGPVTRYEASQFGSLTPVGSTVDRSGSSMAVDPATDEVYVDEQGKVAQFGPAGEPFEEPTSSFAESGPGAISGSIGIAVSGYNKDVYVSNGQGAIAVFGPGALVPDVVTGEVSNIAPEGVAMSATVSGTVNPSGVAVNECKVEYGPTTSYGQSAACAESPAEIGTGSSPVQVHADLTGLTSETTYHYRLVAANANGAGDGSDLTFDVPAAPTVSSHSAFSVARTEADLGAQVNPKYAATTYHLEYGPTTAYGQSTAESQLHLTDDVEHTVITRVAGLSPGTLYHFRLVATNAYGVTAGGDLTFDTLAAPSAPGGKCPNESLREQQAATGLPGCRAYEMVSPVQKEGADIDTAPAMAAIDGRRIMFYSSGSFAGQPTTLATEATPYLATRGVDGWATEGISLPNAQLAFGEEGYMGFTPDMSRGVIKWNDNTRFGPYDPAAQLGLNIYMRNNQTGAFTLMNGDLATIGSDEGFVGGTADFRNVAIQSGRPLALGTPCTGASHQCAWELEANTLRLGSVLPNGEAVQGSVGGANQSLDECNTEHAMSDDGAKLFFSVRKALHQGEEQLYAREDGVRTTLITGSERTLAGGAEGFQASYQDAEAEHGNRVLFTTKNSLVNEDANETNDLYLYDYTKPVGERLTLISKDGDPEAPSGAEVQGSQNYGIACGGVVAASEDLSRVYFVAMNQIVAGGPTTPGPKLYLWDDSGASPRLKYIATLRSSDEMVWAAPAVGERDGGPRQARWSRDGRYLAFISTASLTGFENEGEEEIYRYDAVTGALDCITCRAVSVPLHGEVAFEQSRPFIKPVNHEPQNVSDTGQVFFQTTRGLDLRDSNGQRDVYEYGADGALRLISKGTGDSPSTLLDATPTGSDVFFTTRDELVGWDKDGNVDVYDAHVDGGLPEPPGASATCEGEECLPSLASPIDATPSSATFSGAGNLTPATTKPTPRCRANKCHRKSHGRAKAHNRRKRHVKQHRKHRRHTTRSHG